MKLCIYLGTQIRSKVTNSQTLESLAELPKPGPCTPSLNSSGYGSQVSLNLNLLLTLVNTVHR